MTICTEGDNQSVEYNDKNSILSIEILAESEVG